MVAVVSEPGFPTQSAPILPITNLSVGAFGKPSPVGETRALNSWQASTMMHILLPLRASDNMTKDNESQVREGLKEGSFSFMDVLHQLVSFFLCEQEWRHNRNNRYESTQRRAAP
jgi:hypothetical protein